MRHTAVAFLPVLVLALGCSTHATSHVRSPETTLGRVVVYRNGVAYFERYAEVKEDALHLRVPADKVDDFLKSLTVADAATNRPEPISYPTDIPNSGTGLIDMKIQLNGARPHKLKLTYVTEAPSWKPSYRVTLGPTGKVKIQAWAIVDNTSGEDWRDVKLGVGSSSAMSFRFDLRHVRVVERETLKADDWFAIAPPLGGATYGNQAGPMMKNVLAELDDSTLLAGDESGAPIESLPKRDGSVRHKAPSIVTAGGAASPRPTQRAESEEGLEQAARNGVGQRNLTQLSQSLSRTRGQILVEGYAKKDDADKMAASLDRANRARETLIKNGIPPERVVALGRGEQPGKVGGVRIVEVEAPRTAVSEGRAQDQGTPKGPEGSEPIGTSHFESDSPMTVPRGTSAMVSILNADAEGEVVYLYDPESQRGNEQFPFRSIRLKNPTTSALESGPVTVFGDGRFIGEGLSEPIPARAQAFIPFALDRQIVVERKTSTEDRIRRVITIQRGVFHSELEHRQRVSHTLYNRLSEKTSVYVKHTVPSGYALASGTKSAARLGEAHLFRVDLEPGGKAELVIEETTPMFTTADIRSPDGMGLIRTYLASTKAEGGLQQRVDELLKLHAEMMRIQQKIETTREQMAEYRTRMDELHAQIVTLRAVKATSGLLLGNLEKKLAEISDKLSKATALVVGLQEQTMVTKIRFQDGVSELTVAQEENAKK
jgi:hypothetical protein